jgi:hypothetical protein
VRPLPAVFAAGTALASAGVGADAGLVLAGLPVGLADGLAVAVCAYALELTATRAKKAKSILATIPERTNGIRRESETLKVIRCWLRGASGITRNERAKGSPKIRWNLGV